jgi:hypothetical protein
MMRKTPRNMYVPMNEQRTYGVHWYSRQLGFPLVPERAGVAGALATMTYSPPNQTWQSPKSPAGCA